MQFKFYYIRCPIQNSLVRKVHEEKYDSSIALLNAKQSYETRMCAEMVVWFEETKYAITYRGDPPQVKTINQWFHKFLTTRLVMKQYGGGRGSIGEDPVRSPEKHFSETDDVNSTGIEVNESPRSTFLRVVHRRLRLYAYKFKFCNISRQETTPTIIVDMLHRIETNTDFLRSCFFLDDVSFYP